jgi:hypothetical protein
MALGGPLVGRLPVLDFPDDFGQPAHAFVLIHPKVQLDFDGRADLG